MTIAKIILAAMASLLLGTAVAQPHSNDAQGLQKVQRADAAMDSSLRHARL